MVWIRSTQKLAPDRNKLVGSTAAREGKHILSGVLRGCYFVLCNVIVDSLKKKYK